MAQKNAWNKYKKDEIKELESLCKDYREFLDNGKTERAANTPIQTIIQLLCA